MRGLVNLAATAGLCAAMLWGCTPGTTDEDMKAADRDAASSPARPDSKTADAAQESQSEPQSKPPSKPGSEQSPISKRRVAVKIDDDPRRLLGLDIKSLTGLLGAPRFTRRDPPAQLWRYRDKSCILDLFLYENAKKKTGSTVRHFEARSLSKTDMTARRCLRALLIARRQAKAG